MSREGQVGRKIGWWVEPRTQLNLSVSDRREVIGASVTLEAIPTVKYRAKLEKN